MKKKHLGFTLVELICVVAVLGVMALIEVPSVSRMLEAQRLKLMAEDMVNDLRFAKMYAVSHNVTSVFVKFNGDIDSGIYQGYDIYYPQNLEKNSILKHVDFSNKVIVDGGESTFSSARSENRLEFRCDGSVSPACTIVVKDIENNDKKYITLTIGYTRIMEVER
jgi:prepilin-type N-terminal cleavage/methylation domain-containing protein